MVEGAPVDSLEAIAFPSVRGTDPAELVPEDDLIQQLENLRHICHLSRQIVSNPDLQNVLQEIVTTVAELARTDRCQLLFLHQDGKELFPVASCGLSESFLQTLPRISLDEYP